MDTLYVGHFLNGWYDSQLVTPLYEALQERSDQQIGRAKGVRKYGQNVFRLGQFGAQ